MPIEYQYKIGETSLTIMDYTKENMNYYYIKAKIGKENISADFGAKRYNNSIVTTSFVRGIVNNTKFKQDDVPEKPFAFTTIKKNMINLLDYKTMEKFVSYMSEIKIPADKIQAVQAPKKEDETNEVINYPSNKLELEKLLLKAFRSGYKAADGKEQELYTAMKMQTKKWSIV